MHRIAFALALKVCDAKVEQQICKAGKKQDTSNYGGNCNGTQVNNSSSQWNTEDKGLVSALSGKGNGKWPLIDSTKNGSSNDNSTAGTVDGTKTVANDIVSMSKDDKIIVAGHL